jgi:hypothetical protein
MAAVAVVVRLMLVATVLAVQLELSGVQAGPFPLPKQKMYDRTGITINGKLII